MLGHLGFSYMGLLYLLMLFVPNILWAKRSAVPNDTNPENKVLLVFERAGQVLVTCTVLIFRDYNLSALSLWSTWLFASLGFMLLYEVAWVRYFTDKNRPKELYRSLLGIPLPLATLPIAGFLLLGIYGKVIWLIAAVVILGIGHIGIHAQHFAQRKK
jgi:hypothetical protein